MKNSYRFFSNKECKYFPCHTKPAENEFNCLFCYCPLYLLGDTCGGVFKYSGDKGAKNVKDCMDCHLPHRPEYYDTIVAKLKQYKEASNESM